MGKLVRRTIRTATLLVRKKIELGTWDIPIDMGIADVKAVQAVHTVLIAGTAEGGLFGVKGSVTSGNLTLHGVHSKVEVLTAKNIGSGLMNGFYTEVNVVGTGIVGGVICGARIELYAETGVTMSSDVLGIYVSNYLDKDPVGDYSLMRLEHNGLAVLDSAILIAAGAAQVSYIFALSLNGAKTACDAVTDKTGLAKAGFLKVQLSGMPGGGDRYIQLYGP